VKAYSRLRDFVNDGNINTQLHQCDVKLYSQSTIKVVTVMLGISRH